MDIRASESGDLAAIETLYSDAFPSGDLLPLVRGLLRDAQTTLSLVVMVGSDLVGHVVFTRCGIATTDARLALLGPLAVAFAWQSTGVGSALTRAGLQRLEIEGVSHVCVLGDLAYYGRLGFVSEADITPPYRLSEAWQGAWQWIRVGQTEARYHGALGVPQPWRQPVLWGA